jgi:DNA-binding ferritin-like protein
MTIQSLHDSTAVCFVPSGVVPLPRKVPNTVLKSIPNSQAFLQANNLPNLGTIFLMYAPTVFIMWRMDERFDKVEERFAKVDERMDERFDKVDERFAKVDERMDERFDKVDERFAKVDERMDARFDKVDARFDKVDERFDKVDGQANHLLQGLNNLTVDVGDLKKSRNSDAALAFCLGNYKRPKYTNAICRDLPSANSVEPLI